MNKFILGTLGAIALTVGSVAAFQFGSDQKDNVVVQCLPGTWKLDAELSRRLDPKPDVIVPLTVKFEKQEGVLKAFQAQFPRFGLIGDTVCLEGSAMINETENHFFFVFNENGVNKIVLFTPTRRGGAVDPHAVLINMIVSRDCKKDILFLGGSYARDSASAYVRSGS